MTTQAKDGKHHWEVKNLQACYQVGRPEEKQKQENAKQNKGERPFIFNALSDLKWILSLHTYCPRANLKFFRAGSYKIWCIPPGSESPYTQMSRFFLKNRNSPTTAAQFACTNVDPEAANVPIAGSLRNQRDANAAR